MPTNPFICRHYTTPPLLVKDFFRSPVPERQTPSPAGMAPLPPRVGRVGRFLGPGPRRETPGLGGRYGASRGMGRPRGEPRARRVPGRGTAGSGGDLRRVPGNEARKHVFGAGAAAFAFGVVLVSCGA